MAVGRDIRTSSLPLAAALTAGLNDSGVEVWDLGLCGTEQVYFYTSHLKLDGGIMVTASHNPPEYNGMKFVREESRPLSGDSGLREIEALAAARAIPARRPGRGGPASHGRLEAYIGPPAQLRGPLGPETLKGGGQCRQRLRRPGAGRLEQHLPLQFIKVHHEPDPTFPHGVPNPLLPENRQATAEAVRRHGADVGLAWDGDFDRCFFFDEQGALSRATTSWGSWPRPCWRAIPGPPSSTTRGSPGTPSKWCGPPAAAPS